MSSIFGRRFQAVTIALAAVAVGCGGEGGGANGQQEGDATEASPATLTFSADFRVEQSAPLLEGRTARVVYDEARLPDCRGDFNGKPGWTITGFYTLDESEPETFWVAGFSPTGETKPRAIDLDDAGDLALWFQVTNRWGCSAYDSDFGNDFHFDVEPAVPAGDDG